MTEINNQPIKFKWFLYLISIFPLAGLIIGAIFYKKDKSFALSCIGVALVSAFIYTALHSK